MIALVLLSLCLGGIIGHRLDNMLFKPVMDLVGTEEAPTISKTALAETQDSYEDSIFSQQRDNEGGNGVQRHNANGKKDLLQHLYAGYGCLSSIEDWTKSKRNIDFEILPSKSFDRNSYKPPIDEVFKGIVTENFSENRAPPTDEREIDHKVVNVKDSTAENRFINFPPISYYADFYKDFLVDTNWKDTKRAGTAPVIGCDCKVKIDLLDLGQQHYPRYLMNAVCQSNQSPNEYPQKCWRGSYCKPLEYKLKVLTQRNSSEHGQNDPAMAWLPDELRQDWKFKIVTVAAGCFCSY
ncbi:uncharacterized protein LOC129239051 [Anastrepha obliqua]|uniref:uncharacterized protein LOC129239051 n=1 Tax=Anastrepha obliqua TaxID=95512 RepID=UPI00240A6E30|nr:uncharacterized protein LOC129239051 [Anastrepha obliqua]